MVMSKFSDDLSGRLMKLDSQVLAESKELANIIANCIFTSKSRLNNRV